MTAQFTVYGQAQPGGSKRAVQTGAGVRVIDANRKAAPWKDQIRYQVGAAYDGHPLLDGPLALELTFYQLRPKHHYGTGRNAGIVKAGAPRFPIVAPDVLKLARGVEDALTGLVWRDDAQIVWEFLTKLYGEPARVEIMVSNVEQVTDRDLLAQMSNSHVEG